MPKGQYTVADLAQTPAPQTGQYTAADLDTSPASVQPAQPKGFGSSLGDTLDTVGSHLKNMVSGPYHAITDPPQGAGDKFANAMGPGILPAYRMFGKPTLDSLGSAYQNIKAGNLLKGNSYDNAGNYQPSAADNLVDAIPVAGPWARQVENDAHQKGAVAALAGLGTDALAPKVIPAAMGKVGTAAKVVAPEIINDTVGSLKRDFSRGKDPGTGYFQGKVGPSMSVGSIADKAKAANQDIGAQIGQAHDAFDASGQKIPLKPAVDAIYKPAAAERSALLGPGGTGNATALDNYLSTFKPAVDAAQNSGGFSANDLFGIKRNVAQNTPWGDPTQVGMKNLRQNTTGALSGVLGDAMPETRELNSAWANTNALANRAEARAQTGSFPLTRMLVRGGAASLGAGAGAMMHGTGGALVGGLLGGALDSVPVRTTAASALFKGGQALTDPAAQQAAAMSALFAPKRR